MAYNIGQLRSSSINNNEYYSDNELIFNNSSNTNNNVYKTLATSGFSSQNTYHLSFSIRKNNNVNQNFVLKLIDNNAADKGEQFVGEFFVPRGSSNEIVTFETILYPIDNFNCLLLENINNFIPNNFIETVFCRPLTDFVNKLKISEKYRNLQYIKKIGIQSRMGMLMSINGEPIRIGKNGIYELNHEQINIYQLSFVPSNNSNFFIVDFEYETEEEL